MRSLLTVFFGGLLAGSMFLFAWLWFAGPADIAADRVFRSAHGCGDGDPQSCLSDVPGTLVSRTEVKIQRSPTTYRVVVKPDDARRPAFSGVVHSVAGADFQALHPGEAVALRYYRGDLTDLTAPEGHFRTDANPTEQAGQDEALVQAIEWTLPIPLVPVGAYLYLTRRRRRRT